MDFKTDIFNLANVLFPYLDKLIKTIEEILEPSPMII